MGTSSRASWVAPFLLLGWAVALDRIRLGVERATEGLLRFWPWWVYLGLTLLFVLGLAAYMRHEFSRPHGPLWSRIVAVVLALLWVTFPAVGSRLPLLNKLGGEVSTAPSSYPILAALAVVVVQVIKAWPSRARER